MAPSYEGQAVRVEYRLLVGLQFKQSSDLTFERTIRILPNFNTTTILPPLNEKLSIPFHYMDFCQPINYLDDRSYIRRISPDNCRSESIWDRYKSGIVPKLEDFKRFPKHPLKDRLISGADALPSQAGMFNAFALDSSPVTFALCSDDTLIAQVKLSKAVLRLGEELTVLVSFPPSKVDVFQFKASLVCTEIIAAEFIRPHSNSLGKFQKVYRKHESSSWMHQTLSFSMSLPSDANPTIYSNLFESQWTLELVLACGLKPVSKSNESHPSSESPLLLSTPNQGLKNVVECSFPLKVIPSLAVLLALSLSAHPETHSLGEPLIATITK